jgi:hypothetical protein
MNRMTRARSLCAFARPLRNDPEFRVTGLKAHSLIRLDNIVTLSREVISRRLGTTGPATRARKSLQHFAGHSVFHKDGDNDRSRFHD